jgi:hypothetical protein
MFKNLVIMKLKFRNDGIVIRQTLDNFVTVNRDMEYYLFSSLSN